MVMNPKIIKVTAAIDKTKEQIAELQVKLKDLEKQKILLENDEIVAMFRREKLNEDEFAALLQSGSGRQKTGQQQIPFPPAKPPEIMDSRKEGSLDDIIET